MENYSSSPVNLDLMVVMIDTSLKPEWLDEVEMPEAR